METTVQSRVVFSSSPTNILLLENHFESMRKSLQNHFIYIFICFFQFLQIVSNDLELFHIVHSSQLLVYPIKMFEELSFNMSTIFNVIQRNKSTFKFDMLFQQVKSILMEQSTENKQRHVSSTVTNRNNVGNGGDMTEIGE